MRKSQSEVALERRETKNELSTKALERINQIAVRKNFMPMGKLKGSMIICNSFNDDFYKDVFTCVWEHVHMEDNSKQSLVNKPHRKSIKTVLVWFLKEKT